MKKYAYVTVLSTEDYVKGVLMLFKSIEKTKPKCHNYVVIINENISEDTELYLKSHNLQVIRKHSINIPSIIREKNKQSTSPNWSYTFDKFYIFDLTEFNKIIYIDSDIFIRKNIEFLFDKPHMSAVIAGKNYKGNENWTKINSGLMIIKPEKGISKDLIELMIQEVDVQEAVGDQDIIEKYYQWEKKENLHMEEKYNIFANYIDFYVNDLEYSFEDIFAIHFIGKKKPWMLNKLEKENYIKKCKEEHRVYQLQAFKEYLELIS
ncbi:MAG: glycosyltransferase [Clostridia bacterium]